MVDLDTAMVILAASIMWLGVLARNCIKAHLWNMFPFFDHTHITSPKFRMLAVGHSPTANAIFCFLF